jgi:hypothetical protein
LTATKTSYFSGFAWAFQDTQSNIAITLIDTASLATGSSYSNPSLPFATCVKHLIQRMTLAEKASLMHDNSGAVSRLAIPAYT